MERQAWAFYKQAIDHRHMRHIRLMRGADEVIASYGSMSLLET